ncbi:hypothetical protein QBC33DRAFT_360419 [Phialemonium atrogriseum]|uniref:Uncharacterized protein n=1 Tax=Phialemonium atrogriseum TaxID=1093897 RepID=A0AAJ0C2L1_9PEZI|nr:uncharacterized protein QBC33DRAFT_360419 [Phialemonium atrogriseum]KAK1768790.1 hypothetical protein QBC33DRAFT_360419 [Phialemonium atrogriseum]
MPSEDRRRFNRIQYLLEMKLEEMCARLPVELCLMVAREPVRECAISTIQELWCSRWSSDGDIDVSLGVWAQYVHIHGVRYVAILSNTADPKRNCTKLLDTNKASKVGVLYVLEDHLGIRQLVFASQGDPDKLPPFNPRMGL